jgi:hypothetical protein
MNSISQVKQNFGKVLGIRDDIEGVFVILTTKLKTLKDIYADIAKNHSTNEFSFGLDSFYFQNLLIETDYNKLNSMFVDIDNQIYGEYFNLYRMIKDYALKELLVDRTKRSTNFSLQFETYKRINSTKHYSILVVKEIHDAITACITEMESYLTARENDVVKDEEQSRQGLNIDNLVYAEMYRNSMLKAKIHMFYQYMNAFNSHHNKYYTRLLLKVKMQHGIVNEDINIKQFSGVRDGTSIKELSNIEGLHEQACTIDEVESNQIKSYIGYDKLESSRQTMFNNIITSSSSSSGSSSPQALDASGNIIGEELLFSPKKTPKNNVSVPLFTESDIGKKVSVDGFDSEGVIVFVGSHHLNKTLKIGVVFDKPVGKMNGTIDGHKYFECEENMGLLAMPQKVKLC